MKTASLLPSTIARIKQVAADNPYLEMDFLAERFGVTVEQLRRYVPAGERRLKPAVLNKSARVAAGGDSRRAATLCQYCHTAIYIRNHAQHEKACAAHTEEERARYRERRTYAK